MVAALLPGCDRDLKVADVSPRCIVVLHNEDEVVGLSLPAEVAVTDEVAARERVGGIAASFALADPSRPLEWLDIRDGRIPAEAFSIYLTGTEPGFAARMTAPHPGAPYGELTEAFDRRLPGLVGYRVPGVPDMHAFLYLPIEPRAPAPLYADCHNPKQWAHPMCSIWYEQRPGLLVHIFLEPDEMHQWRRVKASVDAYIARAAADPGCRARR